VPRSPRPAVVMGGAVRSQPAAQISGYLRCVQTRVNYAALDQVSPAATCRCVQTSIAYGVRWPLRHRQVRSRVASAVRIAGSTQGIRSVDSPLDDLFECSNTSRSCYRPGAKMGSHPAKSRQESGGVWTVICPGKQHFANLLDSSRPARGLLHTEEVTGSIPVSPTQLSGRFRTIGSAVLILVQQQSAATGLRHRASARKSRGCRASAARPLSGREVARCQAT